VKGWISYPRTETDQFDKAIDLRKLVEKQAQDHRWGPYAQRLATLVPIVRDVDIF
jgi:DNA topoisomerase-3